MQHNISNKWGKLPSLTHEHYNLAAYSVFLPNVSSAITSDVSLLYFQIILLSGGKGLGTVFMQSKWLLLGGER